MTHTLTPTQEQLLAETTAALDKHTASMKAVLDNSLLEAQEDAKKHLRALGEAARRTFHSELERLERTNRLAIWPIAFLAGAMGGATAALVVHLILP